MSRNLDTSLAAALPNSNIMPVVFAALTFKSGVIYVWTGVGNFVFNGNTYVGVGSLGKISAISEGSDVNAEGITVTLSGIGLSPFTIGNPTPPSDVTNPVTVPLGQYVAWSFPTVAVPFVGTGEGTASVDVNGCSLIMTSSTPLGADQVSATWSGFKLPYLPDDAVIENVYCVALISGTGSGALNDGLGFTVPTSGVFNAQYTSTSTIGLTTADIEAFSQGLEMNASGNSTFYQTLNAGFVGLAIYYSSATNAPNVPTLVNEAMDDYQLGGPAQIWYGLLNQGALIGNPYLIFSGQMDQPEVTIDVQSSSITIALENRLVNLSRPTARRYTSADQHLMYSDDIGFNWVEILNDIALGWGTT